MLSLAIALNLALDIAVLTALTAALSSSKLLKPHRSVEEPALTSHSQLEYAVIGASRR